MAGPNPTGAGLLEGVDPSDLTMRQRNDLTRSLLASGADPMGIAQAFGYTPSSSGVGLNEGENPSSLENVTRGTWRNVVADPIGGLGEGLYVPEAEGYADDVSRFAGEKLGQLSDWLKSGEGYQDWEQRLAAEEAEASFGGKLRNAVETEAGDMLGSLAIMAATRGKGAPVLAMQNYGRALDESAGTQLQEEFVRPLLEAGMDPEQAAKEGEAAYRKARREDPAHYARLQVAAGATAALDTLADAVPILKGPGGELFKPAAQKAMKAALARHGGKMTKQAMAEAVTEVAQVIQNVSINDPEVRSKLMSGDLEGAARTIYDKHGEELALSAAAGGALGGAGGLGVSMAEGKDPEKTEERTNKLQALANEHGISNETINEILQDKEQRPKFVGDMAELEGQEANADRMEQAAGQAATTPGATPEAIKEANRAAANARETANASRDRIFASYKGGQTVAQVEQRKADAETARRDDIETTFKEFGVTPTQAIDPEEAASVASNLRLTQDNRKKAQDRVERLARSNSNPEKTQEARVELEEAREAEANAQTSAFEFAGDKAGQEKAAQKRDREKSVSDSFSFLQEIADEEGQAAADRRAKKWQSNEKKGKTAKKIKDEIKKLEADLDDPTLPPKEMRAKRAKIAELRSKDGTTGPASEAASRWLQAEKGDLETQSPPLGGEAAATPSGDTVQPKGKATPEVAPPATATEPKAAEASTSVVANPKNVSDDAKNDLKNARAKLRKSPDDPEAEAQADGAATRALQEAGIANPTPEQVDVVISLKAGGTVAQRVRRAAAMEAAPAPAAPAPAPAPAAPAPAPVEPAAAGTDVDVAQAEIDAKYGNYQTVDEIPEGSPLRKHEVFRTPSGQLVYKDELTSFGKVKATPQEAHQWLLKQTNGDGFEHSVILDEDGRVLGVGTLSDGNAVAYSQAAKDAMKDPTRRIRYIHSHPFQSPLSSADHLMMKSFPGMSQMEAVLPDGTIQRATRTGETQDITFAQVKAARETVVSGDFFPDNQGDFKLKHHQVAQEALTRALSDAGLIAYNPDLRLPNQKEIRDATARATAAIEGRAADRGGASQPAGAGAVGAGAGRPGSVQSGERAGAGPAAADRTASGLDLGRTADQEPLPGVPADPQRVADLTQPFVDMVETFPRTPTGAINKSNLTAFEKAVANGDLTQAGMNAGLSYAANAVSHEGTEASTVVLQAARAMFPKAKMTPQNFAKTTFTRKNGKKVPQLNLDADWKARMNVAYQFLRRVGQEEGMGFGSIKLPLKQKNGFWDFDATHFTMPNAMTDYLQISPPQSALFTQPMPDPTDTTNIVRNVDTNVFTPEAIDRMRATAERMQRNVYYLDQDAIAALNPDDLISDKKLGEQLLKRNDDGVFVDKDGTPVDDLPQQPTRDGGMTDHPQKKFIQTQRYRQTKKLAMLKRMAEINGDKPIGYRYRVDDKGRIYADGAFTPQTGDYVKGILRVGEPDGPKLKDMPMVDHSASGWQVATLMTRDKEAANWFNLGSREGEQALALQPNYKKRDMYDTLMTDLKAEIINDAQNHPNEKTRKLAQLFKERVFDTNMPFGKVQIKPAVIAVNYAGGRANFQERLMEVYGEQFKDVPPADRAGLWGYTSGAAYDQLRAKAPDTMKFQDWAIEKLASLIEQVDGNKNALRAKPDLQFSVGLDGTYAKIKPISKDVKVKAVDGKDSSVEQTVDIPTTVVDANATARSIFSQIIQGFDASILHRAMEIYGQNGDDFVTSNHDSYTTPVGHAGRMAAASREAMKQVMKDAGDAPGRLRAEIEAQAAKFGVTIEGLNDPNVFNEDGSFRAGDYDLNDLDTAVPVFVENAGDLPPALTDLQGNLIEEGPDVDADGNYTGPAIARGIEYDAADAGETTGVKMDTSLPKAAQFAQDGQFSNQRDFKVALQEKALAAQKEQGIDLRQNIDENIERLADFAVEDAKAALVDNQNAVGWYDTKVTAAKNIIAQKHPEILTSPEAELRFIWALAVTSNGLKVDKNFEIAEQAYVRSKNSKMLPTDVGVGEAKKSINNGLDIFNKMSEVMKTPELISFMTERLPVRDINAKMKELGIKNEKGKPVTVSGEQMGTVLPGAVILGPKIGGGFFSNLYGNFNELTMDRWFMRSVGRWRGDLISDRKPQIKLGQKRLKEGLKELTPEAIKQIRQLTGVPVRKTMTNANLDNLANDLAKRSAKPAWRTQINQIDGGEEIRLAGNSLAKDLDGQKEQPAGATERTYLRKVLTRALERLQEDPNMSGLTMSDLQALLWYPEKTLYDTMKKPEGQEAKGYSDEDAPDYENAARKLVSDRLGRDRQAGQRDGGRAAERSPEGARRADAEGGPAYSMVAGGITGDGNQVGDAAGLRQEDGTLGVDSGGVRGGVQPVDAATFDAAMDKAAAAMGPEAAQVSRVKPTSDAQRFLLDDGMTGYALDGDNLIGAFSHPGSPKGAAQRILQDGIARGGRRLDGFDTYLPRIYALSGFKAVARLPFDPVYAPSIAEGSLRDWDAQGMEAIKPGWGSPDVVFMVYDPDNATPDTDNTVGDYDEGIQEQDRSLSSLAGGSGQGADGGRGTLDGGLEGAAPIAAGIDEWVGLKSEATDNKIRSEISGLAERGRKSANALLSALRHDPSLFSYDPLMNAATRADGVDYGPEFFKTHAKFTAGMRAKLAQLSKGQSQQAANVYLDMGKAQLKDHQRKLIDAINRGSVEVSDIDPATKMYRIPAETSSPIAMGMDITARVKAAPKKAGIAQPIEYKTAERVADSLFNGAADPGGTFDKIQQWLGRVGRSAVRNVFDRQAALRQIEALAGMMGASTHDGMAKMAQMLTASTGRIGAMMSFGAPKWNAETKLFEIDRATKGLEKIFNFTGVADYQNFQGWAYAKRDRDLMKRGKSPRMTDALRTEYEAISDADKARYDAMLDDYKVFNNSLRKLMLDSGLISKEQMDALAKDNEYVPMFRQFDDPEQFGLQNVFYGKDGGFSHPDPNVKAMKDGARKVGEPGGGDFGDLIEGIHNNAVAVMHAASQNLAHAQIYNFMQDNMSHEASKVKPYTLGKKEKKAARGGGDVDAVKFYKDGKEVYWKPKGDPEWTSSLHMALAGLRPAQLDGIDRALKTFNGYMRQMVTSTPAFAIRSVIRDAGQAYVQSGTNPAGIAKRNATMLAESWQGYSQETQDLMMASGVGGYQMQGMPEVDAANLRKKIKAQEAGRMHQIRQAFGAYERVLGGTELAARSEVYEGIKARPGQTEADAAYEALNMIDYNRKGASRVVQRLSYMVLFLNPRLQGMYRLFNETSGDNNKKYLGVTASLAARGLVMTGIGLGIRALTAMDEEDEERYRALSVSDRATYFHIPIPGSDRFLRLPKPFEVGAAFATLPVAGFDAVAMGEEGMNDLGMMAAHVFSETFSLNPTPQAVKPIVEVMLNRNMFTGRDIEGMRLEGLPKELRADLQTSGLAKLLGNRAISPVQIQHLLNGYLGPLGMFVYNGVDATAAAAVGGPNRAAKPEGVFGGLPGIARIPADFTAGWLFSKTDAERGTRHVGNFYDLHSRIRQYTSAINEASRMGDVAEVERLRTESAQIMPLKKYMNKVGTRLSKLNRELRVAQLAPDLSDAERQKRIAKINIAKNDLVRGAMETARKQGVAGSFAGGLLIGDTVGL